MTLLTQAAFAARRGVGKSAVSNWKKAGLVVFAEGDDGKVYVDAERTEARLNARLDPMRGRPATAPVDAPELPIEAVPDAGTRGSGVHGARAELLAEQLVGTRLKNAEMARELVPAMEAERRCAELGRMARERVQAELRGQMERLAAERDPRAIWAVIEAATDRAFHALADAVDRGELDADDEDGAAELPEAA